MYAQYQSVQSDIGTPNKYPGTPLRQGDTGNNVKLVQFWLKIARSTYSSLLDLSVDGIFGAGTRNAVIRFQNYFGLTADGVVGQLTWNKLYEVYNGIANDLLDASLRPGDFPGTLRLGSTGTAVRELQFYLYLVSAYESAIPAVAIDGSFGAATEASVRAFQRFAGLTVDGIVGQATWDALYSLASRLRLSGPVITITRRPYPGTPLTIGSTGADVAYFTTLIDRISYYFDSVQSFGVTAVFDENIALSVRSLQQLLELPATGVVNEATWFAAEALSLALLANAPATDLLTISNDYPEFASAEQSAGAHVMQIQQWQNRLAELYCPDEFTDEGGTFGPEETRFITQVQTGAGLSPNGVVDRATWNVLREAAQGGSCNGTCSGV